MAHLVHIDGNQIINLDRVCTAKLYRSGRSEDIVTLWYEDGNTEVTGQDATDLWEYLENRADVPNMESEAIKNRA